MNLPSQPPGTLGRSRQAVSLAFLLVLTLVGSQAVAQVKTPPGEEIPPARQEAVADVTRDRTDPQATQPPAGMPVSPLTVMFPTALDRPMQPDRPFIGLLRYDEDWSFLKDPANRTELWDPLKYIGLGKADWYLSLGGETRQRFEIYNKFPFSALAPSDKDGYYMMRYMLHGDLHMGQHVRVFAQLKSALIYGKDFVTGADKDELDVNQLFVDINSGLGETGDSFTLRVGRQELHYGMGRLLTIREGPNNRQGWDGARGILQVRNWQIDAFYALGVEDRHGVFDDRPTDDHMIWGLYATTMVLPGAGIDVYYLGDAVKKAFFRREKFGYFQDFLLGIGDEVRHSVGTRLFGGHGPWDWDIEAIFQAGEHRHRNIRAYDLSVGGGYTVPQLPASPRFTLGLDFASGDRDAADGDVQTFRPIVFRGNYSGEAAFLQLSNVIKVHPGVDLHLRKDMFLFLDFPLFWRMSREDGLYSPGGFVVAEPVVVGPTGPRAINDRYVGFQPSFQYTWQITQYLMFSTSYAHFVSGGFLKKAGRGDADFGAVWFTYRF